MLRSLHGMAGRARGLLIREPDRGTPIARAGSTLQARFGFTTAEGGRSAPAVVNIMREVAEEGGFAIDVVNSADAPRIVAVSADMRGNGRFAGVGALSDGPHAAACIAARLEEIFAGAVARG